MWATKHDDSFIRSSSMLQFCGNQKGLTSDGQTRHRIARIRKDPHPLLLCALIEFPVALRWNSECTSEQAEAKFCVNRFPKRPDRMFRNQYDTDVTVWSPEGRLLQVRSGSCVLSNYLRLYGALRSTIFVHADEER
jgi:Proteasome subunit A N-terminal signature